METVFYFLVLVPHRDARLPLRAWGDSLFNAGLLGGWIFPGVAPLALLKRPLSGGELRFLAHGLRERLSRRHGGHGGMEEIGGWEIEGERAFVWGPKLNIEIPDDFFAPVAEAVDSPIAPLVLGAALLQGAAPSDLPAPPEVSFSAAALANMECRFRPCGEDGDPIFEWGIGPLQWLPKRVDY